MLPVAGVCPAAHPFFAVLLQRIFPGRTLVLVAPDLKTQESFQQDLETWLQEVQGSKFKVQSPGSQAGNSQLLTSNSQLLFYPAWEILPHEGKLPHADTISDRLQTLVMLSEKSAPGNRQPVPRCGIATSVTALLQKTFSPAEIQRRTRVLHRGDKINPLDLIEWLEEQGYEPEAQVTRKGEIALRGGILDVWPLTSPWPVRLEFFGDELESLRHFDPPTQISREEIPEATIPPGGELGILKRGTGNTVPPATLLDHLPRETIFLLCEPEALATHAEEYAAQIPAGDAFFISWPDFLQELKRRDFVSVELVEGTGLVGENPHSALRTPHFESLDAFRPLAGRAPEPQIAEARRREFFHQLHRWLRQGYAVHIFCNNDGERQRFQEIWAEMGWEQEPIASSQQSVAGAAEQTGDTAAHRLLTTDYKPQTHLGALSRGFLCDEAKLVVVTDAEIFGRYKIQRPRRLKSPHALALRSALDIDFTELEEGDLVVHIQYGIGRFLGLRNLPTRSGTGSQKPSTFDFQPSTECLVIEYAPATPGDEPPKLYVPVTEAHLVGKYVGAGKAHPPLNTLGGTRWKKAKEQAERAVRDVAAELLQIQAVRETQPGHAFKPDAPWQPHLG